MSPQTITADVSPNDNCRVESSPLLGSPGLRISFYVCMYCGFLAGFVLSVAFCSPPHGESSFPGGPASLFQWPPAPGSTACTPTGSCGCPADALRTSLGTRQPASSGGARSAGPTALRGDSKGTPFICPRLWKGPSAR